MTIHLNTRPENRKDMVKAISELTGLESTYLRTPTYAYQIGGVTVNRDGTIDYETDAIGEDLIPMLIDRGWLDPAEYHLEDDAEIPEQTPDGLPIAIHLPMDDWTVPQAKNLLRLVCKSQNLIRHMVGGDTPVLQREFVESICEDSHHVTIADIQQDLEAGAERGDVQGLNFEEGHFMMMFPGDAQNPDRWKIMADLMSGLMRMAQGATRVSLDSKATPENEKFYAHSLLLRMGFGGPEYKDFRETLLKHLNGYAAFKSTDAMKAHKAKYAAIRRKQDGVHVVADSKEVIT